MLSQDDIRRRLLQKNPERIKRPGFRHAAVLVPIYWNDAEPHVVFTKRSEKVPHHKGQISFPGGSIDADDDSAFSAAVRETHEEIGIPPDEVRFIGRLDDIITVTNFIVSPFVAEIPREYPYKVSDFEIDEVFDLPLRELADESKMRTEVIIFDRRNYPIYYFEHRDYIIWGATGKILRHLLSITEIMPGEVPSDAVLTAD